MFMNFANLEKTINDLVTRWEEKTSCEIVVALLPESDLYPAAPYRLAMIFGFFFYGLGLIFQLHYYHPHFLTALLIAGIALGFLSGRLSKFKRFVLSDREIEEEVYQKALETFFLENIHHTKKKNGILLYVSQLEKRIIILADKGLNDQVSQGTWDAIVQSLIPCLKENQFQLALEKGIEAIGMEAVKHFPTVDGCPDDGGNQLKNQLVTPK